MTTNDTIHDLVADLLTYPGPDSGIDVMHAIDAVVELMPDTAVALAELRRVAEAGPPHVLEELFCRTFDNNADRALEVGWQIWGENYDRGAFLVKMRDLMRRTGVTESAELPDHLSHALKVLGRLDEQSARTLAAAAVYPAVQKMTKAFEGEEHPYRGVLETVERLVATHVASLEPIDV